MTIVLVDGSNVAKSDTWRRCMLETWPSITGCDAPDDDQLRSSLLDTVASWASPLGYDVTVVFDGEGPLGSGTIDWGDHMRVIGSGRNDGDSVIERLAAECVAGGRRFRLVTSDALLREVAGARADLTIDVDTFVAEITAPIPGQAGELQGVDADVRPGTRLAETIDDDTLARLERMRRGEDT